MKKHFTLFSGTMALLIFTVIAGSTYAAAGEKTSGGGTVTAINGSMITVQAKKMTVTVDAGHATIIKVTIPQNAKPTRADITVSDIHVGDNLRIQGTLNGSTVTATSIVDAPYGGGMDNGSSGGQGNPPSAGKGPGGGEGGGGGDQGKPENPTKCVEACQLTGRNCIAKVSEDDKVCLSEGTYCRTVTCETVDANGNRSTAEVMRACVATKCDPVENACHNVSIQNDATCRDTQGSCITQCQKASKPAKPGVPGGQGQGGPGGQTPPQPPANPAAEAAEAAGDYAAWVKAVSVNGQLPDPVKSITKDNFPKLVEAHGYQKQAKELMKKAEDIMKGLGITPPSGGPEGGSGGGLGQPQ